MCVKLQKPSPSYSVSKSCGRAAGNVNADPCWSEPPLGTRCAPAAGSSSVSAPPWPPSNTKERRVGLLTPPRLTTHCSKEGSDRGESAAQNRFFSGGKETRCAGWPSSCRSSLGLPLRSFKVKPLRRFIPETVSVDIVTANVDYFKYKTLTVNFFLVKTCCLCCVTLKDVLMPRCMFCDQC